MSVLADLRIVNTRAVHQAAALSQMLAERGATVLHYPCLAIAPPEDTHALDDSLRELHAGAFDWLVITSVNTVLSLAQRLAALALTLTEQADFRVAAVGDATAASIQADLGLSVDLVPRQFVAESLAYELVTMGAERVFLPESAIARPTLAHQLQANGVQVQVVEAYQTVIGTGGIDLRAALQAGEVDIIIFTSSSTVRYCLQRLAVIDGTDPLFESVTIACIGSKTAATAHQLGFNRVLVPQQFSLQALIAHLEYFHESDQ